MRPPIRVLGRVALVAIPLALGLLLLGRALAEREPPALRPQGEAATAVRVITMEPAIFVPEFSAFGSVEPVATWSGVAQVAGEVIRLDRDLRPGRLVEAGTEVIRIDATDYELAEAQALAQLAGAEARLAEMVARGENLRASLAIEEQALALAEEELERRRTLLARGTGSQAAVDQAAEAVLRNSARARDMENALNLLPAQERVQEAERAIAEARLAEARRSLERTRVVMPFDGRIAELAVEQGQFVTTGQVMLVAEDMSAAEVSARFTLEQIKPMVADSVGLATITDLPASEVDAVVRSLDLTAELRLVLGERVVSWPASIRRVSFALEPQTRTIGVVLAVDDPIRQAIPGQRPPLVRDMFVEVVLRGGVRRDAMIVPREALERSDAGWSLHVADDADRLRRRPVEVSDVFGNVALIAGGLAPGERVVVSAIDVPIEGMLLAPRADHALRARLRAEAGEAVR